jgi:alpha-ketoglutarate-dependent taurine dioxygenase
MHPGIEGVDFTAWATGHRLRIDELLIEYGAILFRDFTLMGIVAFEQLVEAVSGGLLDYTYRSTPRKQVQGRIYTSTEYPSDQSIPLHNELSYASAWPMKIWFYCVQAAASGGETPIADSRQVYAGIDPRVVERFERAGVMYVRNYGEGVDLPWQEVFQTSSQAAVEEICRNANLMFEWKSGDRLRTRQICQATTTHPKTGERVWFNQAHLFHISRVKLAVRESLLSTFAEEDLPRNVYYGDGSPIESATLDHIGAVYDERTVTFTWRQGDILLLDNVLTAHGRRPFGGERKVVVGIAETVPAY